MALWQIIFCWVFTVGWVVAGVVGSVYWFKFIYERRTKWYVWLVEATLMIVMALCCGPIWLMYSYSEWKHDRDFWEGRF